MGSVSCNMTQDTQELNENRMVLPIKKNQIMPFAATWMDLQIVTLSEVSHKEKRQIPYDATYMWNLKYDTNERN